MSTSTNPNLDGLTIADFPNKKINKLKTQEEEGGIGGVWRPDTIYELNQYPWLSSWLQSTICLVMFFWINSEASDWIEWRVPYDTFLFVGHLLASLLDTVHWSISDGISIKLPGSMLRLYHAIWKLLLIVDFTALARQISSVNSYGTDARYTQLGFIAGLCFFTLVRGGYLKAAGKVKLSV